MPEENERKRRTKRAKPKQKKYPTLAEYNQNIVQLFYAAPALAANQLHKMRVQLETERLLMEETDPLRSFVYAHGLVQTDAEDREELFASIALLLERQPEVFTRKKVISLLLEMSAIEIGEHGKRSGKHSFGQKSLKTLKELVPSVIDLGLVLLDCVDDDAHLIEIINGASATHLMANLPLFLGILKNENSDDFYGEMARTIPCMQALFEDLLDRHVKKILPESAPAEENGIDIEDAGNDPKERLRTLRYLIELFIVISQNTSSAAALHDSKLTNTIFTNIKTIEEIMQTDEKSPQRDQMYDVYRLIGSLCKYNKEAADFFTGHSVDGAGDDSLLKDVIRRFLSLPLDPSEMTGTKRPIPYANIVYCLYGMCTNSPHTAHVLLQKGDMKNELARRLFQVAESFTGTEPQLSQSCLQFILLLFTSKSRDLKPFQKSMRNNVPIGALLQSTCKNLLTSAKSQSSIQGSKDALITSLQIISHCNAIQHISNQLNEEHAAGYDREDILFKILLAREDDEFLDDDAKLQAAHCLSTVDMEEFSDKEIRRLVTMFSTLPVVVPNKIYQVMSNLLFLLFEIAMDGLDSSNAADHVCGTTFRALYATEVTSTVYNIITKSLSGDQASLKGDRSKNSFQIASIKFLQTAWKALEFRTRSKDTSTVDMLIKALVVEQETLRAFKLKIQTQISQRLCCSCGEPITKTKSNPVGVVKTANCDNCQVRHQGKELEERAHELFFFMLYLEQTFVGFDIETMFQSLAAISDVDLVAFRVIHCIANVIEEQGASMVLERLQGCPGYPEWLREKSGNTFVESEKLEKQDWSSRIKVMRDLGLKKNVRIGVARRKNIGDLAESMADIQCQYWKDVYHKKKPKLRQDHFATHIKASESDDRVINLVAKNAETGEVLAFCGGGPFRGEGMGETCAELYGIFSKTEVGAFMTNEELLQMLLSEFSHRMFQFGFTRCVAYVHKEEKVLFARATWSNASDFEKNIDLMKDEKNKQFLFEWDLMENVWQDSRHHKVFIKEKGIARMLNFLVRDAIGIEAKDFNVNIRVEMEKFGASLTNDFNTGQDGDLSSGLGKSSDVEDIDAAEFESILKTEFLTRHTEERENEVPIWEQFVIGTEEESFLKNVTSCASLNPNMHTNPDDDPMDDPNPDDSEDDDEIPDVGESDEVVQKEEEGVHQELILKKVHSWLLEPQVLSSTAAMFRCFYILLTCSTGHIRRECLKILRKRSNLAKMNGLVASFNYGIRRCVTEGEPDGFSVCNKFLILLEELLEYDNSKKDKKLAAVSLAKLDLYECITEICVDISIRIVALLNSRNQNTKDALHLKRFLYPEEEHIISSLCRVLANTLNQVATITFFKGDSYWIAVGNQKCRQKAVKLLFTTKKLLTDSIYSFLMYDLETKHETANASLPQGFVSTRIAPPKPKTPHRDSMRVHIADLAGQMFVCDEEYKYKFLETFATAGIKADMYLRRSFLSDCLQISHCRRFREKLGQALKANGAIDPDETVLDHAFVVMSVLGEFSNTGENLIVITDTQYYVSSASFDRETVEMAHLMEVDDMGQFTELDCINFDDVRKVFTDKADQMIAIKRYVLGNEERLGSTRLAQITEIFYNARLGVMNRIGKTIANKCRDDLNRIAPFVSDVFTGSALKRLFTHDADLDEEAEVAACTYVELLNNGSVEPKMLIWCMGDGGDTNHLLVCDYDQSGWVPWVGFKDEEEQLNRLDTLLWRFVKSYVKYDIAKIDSVDFTDDESAHMVIDFEDDFLHISFKCDTARQIWRVLLEKQLFAQDNVWTASVFAEDSTSHRVR